MCIKCSMSVSCIHSCDLTCLMNQISGSTVFFFQRNFVIIVKGVTETWMPWAEIALVQGQESCKGDGGGGKISAGDTIFAQWVTVIRMFYISFSCFYFIGKIVVVGERTLKELSSVDQVVPWQCECLSYYTTIAVPGRWVKPQIALWSSATVKLMQNPSD